ncbi:MAG: FAD-dependent thymidylate synthase [Eubacteriales bacterium]
MGQVKSRVYLLTHTPNPEEAIALCAKLCYSDAEIKEIANGISADKCAGFIKTLIKMNHLAPIEHASFTFGIEGVSRALLAQITRHRLASFCVKSQRYVGAKNEQGVFAYVVPPSIEALGEEAVLKFNSQMNTLQGWYNEWVDALGNAGEKSNEDARFVLPNACETKIIVTMNARELLHFFELRCCFRAQWEIREVAWEMFRLVYKVAPNIFSLGGPSCINHTCNEGKMSCGRSAESKKRFWEMTNGQ